MSSAFSHISRRGFRVLKHSSLYPPRQIRNSSIQSTQFDLDQELTARPSNIIYDYLSPTPSHLLNISLADFLPESCHPPSFTSSNLSLPLARPEHIVNSARPLLPQAHHLVYFSPQIPGSALLPDGTDPLQSPGPPFVRRMWAGGSLLFNTSRKHQLLLDNERAACIERITDVTVKGTEGDEKVFVNIERRIGLVHAETTFSNGEERDIDDTRLMQRYQVEDHEELGQASVLETRNIVFMREKPTAMPPSPKTDKIVRAPHEPDFSVRMVPNQSLLFRFSALTFNAHGIHLDPQYAKEVEGHRNILLHGPLSLVLLLSVLRSQLQEGEMIKRFDYRNLAPLYANEEMRICIRKDREKKYDVWIEGQSGGYAVKGSAVIGLLRQAETRL